MRTTPTPLAQKPDLIATLRALQTTTTPVAPSTPVLIAIGATLGFVTAAVVIFNGLVG